MTALTGGQWGRQISKEPAWTPLRESGAAPIPIGYIPTL